MSQASRGSQKSHSNNLRMAHARYYLKSFFTGSTSSWIEGLTGIKQEDRGECTVDLQDDVLRRSKVMACKNRDSASRGGPSVKGLKA
jgi:hypothetical protein